MDFFVWDIDPIIIKFGFLQVRWYSLFFVGSFLLGYLILKKIFEKENLDPKSLDDLLIWTLLGAVVGARLFHTLVYEPDFYLSHPLKILYIWEGGLASHGGMIGVLIVLYIYSKKMNISYIWLLSRVALPASLVAFSIRVGNFFNSEILGKATELPWGVIFSRVDLTPRHPVQLYEAFSYLVIGLILWVLYKRLDKKISSKLILALFLFLIFLARFIIEFFKEEQASYSLSIPLTVGQLLSIPIIIIGLIFTFMAIKDIRKYKKGDLK